MLSPKTKALFIEWSEYGLLAARASSFEPPLTLEAMNEFTLADPEETAGAIREFAEVKGGAYAVAVSGVYPQDRFIRRFTMDPQARSRNQNYFADTLKEKFRIDAEKNAVAILSARDGSDFDLRAGNEKELMVAGAPQEHFLRLQEQHLEHGIYPQRLEMGTVATLGGLIHNAMIREDRSSTLMLEIASEAAQIMIFKDGMLDISRPVPFGLNSMYPVIQNELGLRDEASAKKLFYSETFDFTELGPKLLRKLLKELQASTGFYEVQTGQTISKLFIPLLPANLRWIGETLAANLGVELFTPEFGPWLDTLQIQRSDAVQVDNLDPRWLGVFALMGRYGQAATQTSERETGKKGRAA